MDRERVCGIVGQLFQARWWGSRLPPWFAGWGCASSRRFDGRTVGVSTSTATGRLPEPGSLPWMAAARRADPPFLAASWTADRPFQNHRDQLGWSAPLLTLDTQLRAGAGQPVRSRPAALAATTSASAPSVTLIARYPVDGITAQSRLSRRRRCPQTDGVTYCGRGQPSSVDNGVGRKHTVRFYCAG